VKCELSIYLFIYLFIHSFIHSFISFIPFNSGSRAHKTTRKSNYIKIHKHKNTERQTENTQEKLHNYYS